MFLLTLQPFRMRRLFGGKKEPAPPPPSLTDATDTVSKRTGVLEEKIRGLDKQLLTLKTQIKATRPGPAQNRIKQRAMQILKQKRMIEQQRDQVRHPRCPPLSTLEGMAWNMEQASFAHENIKTAINTSQAMKGGTAALKTEMKNVSIDEIEDNLDDMSELLEMTNEIQEAMSRSYGLSDDIDEADLDDELAAIDEQLALDDE
eukprot:261555-Hanusia_phi.AAC.1